MTILWHVEAGFDKPPRFPILPVGQRNYPPKFAISGPDVIWPISLTPNWSGGRTSLTWRRKIAHMHPAVDLWAPQVNPVHSGTRSPGLVCPQGCHPGNLANQPGGFSTPSCPSLVAESATNFWAMKDSVKMVEKTVTTDIAGSLVVVSGTA